MHVASRWQKERRDGQARQHDEPEKEDEGKKIMNSPEGLREEPPKRFHLRI